MDQPPRSTKGLSWYALIVRIVLGAVFISHGYQKLFADLSPDNLSDAHIAKLVEMNLVDADAEDKKLAVEKAAIPKLYGVAFAIEFSPNLNAVAENSESAKQLVDSIKRYAKPLAWAAALTEFLGGCCMVIGLLTRIWALGLLGTMVTAAFLAHWNSAGMNIFDEAWQVGNGGVEYTFVLGLLAFGVFFGGPGKISFDRLMFRRKGYEPIPVQHNPKSNKNAKPASEHTGTPPRVVSQNLPGTPISMSQRPAPSHQPSPISPNSPHIQTPNPGTNPGNPGNPGTNTGTGSPGPGTPSSGPNPTGGPDGKGKGTGSYGIRRPSRSEEEPPTRPI